MFDVKVICHILGQFATQDSFEIEGNKLYIFGCVIEVDDRGIWYYLHGTEGNIPLTCKNLLQALQCAADRYIRNLPDGSDAPVKSRYRLVNRNNPSCYLVMEDMTKYEAWTKALASISLFRPGSKIHVCTSSTSIYVGGDRYELERV